MPSIDLCQGKLFSKALMYDDWYQPEAMCCHSDPTPCDKGSRKNRMLIK